MSMMRCYLVLFLSLAAVTAYTFSPSERHYGSQVLRITPQNEADLEWLRDFERNYENALDFWQGPTRLLNRGVDVWVPKSMIRQIRELLLENEMQFNVMIPDVQGVIDEQFTKMAGRTRPSTLADFDYSVYHPYDEIRQWVLDMATDHRDIVSEFLVTESYEGREMRAIKISVKPNAAKKSIWFEGGIHAREWISPATVMYIANQLVTDYKSGDQRVVKILESWDVFIVPSLNVDGYAYTWATERMWRKTRSLNPDFGCVGTDANRNWPYKWGGDGASPWACSNTYRGETALSEVEMKAITSYALARTKEQEIRIFIDWHSYAQLWLAPWSYDDAVELPPESPDQLKAAQAGVDAQFAVHAFEYIAGPSARILYEASGASNDWGFGGLGAKYSYVMELRDTGEYGFLLPEDQIIPCGEENYAATLALAEYVLDNDF
ncbi:carboxypeptidase B-like [Amphiura filiformis]|uniref:carboxypeptidase B-like n=1 Tax=Amphiura filiformis TaxID=82378 RepID=UPI003B225BCD